jgi:hypothetical protein
MEVELSEICISYRVDYPHYIYKGSSRFHQLYSGCFQQNDWLYMV